jgi:O-antigen ligase
MPSVADADAPAATDRLTSFERRIASLPAAHPRRIGLWLLRIGMAFFLPACITGTAGPNICYGIAGAGFLLCAPPLRALTGLGWGLAFAGWLGASAHIAGALGPERFPMHGIGLSYTWTSMLLAQVAFRHRATLEACLWMTLAVVGVSAALCLLQLLCGIGDGPLHLARRGLPYEHGVGFYSLHLTEGPVMAAASLLFASALCTGLLVKRWARVGIAVALLGLVCSTSRMAYLGAAAGWWLWRGLGDLKRMAVAAALVGLAGALALLFLLLVQPEHTRAALHGQDGRWTIWRASLTIIAEHPLVGTGGPEGYKEAYNDAFRRANPGDRNEFARGGGAPHAHNSLISIAAEHGVPAVPLYLALLGSILAALWRRRAACPAAWRLGASVTASMLLAGMFEHLAGHVVPANVLFAILGMALALPSALAAQEAAEPAEAAPVGGIAILA